MIVVSGDKSPVRVRMDTIVIEVAARHRLRPEQLTGHCRRKELVAARFEAMWQIQRELGLSLVQIGRYFDGRDHTTVRHAIAEHAKRRQVAA